jgi:hypothetical protein
MEIILNYSAHSFVVSGDTKPHKDQLKALGGKYNPNLRDGMIGYIFSNSKLQDVQNFINNTNTNNTNTNNTNNSNNSTTNNNNNNNSRLKIQPKIKLPTTVNVTDYPNRFIAGDGLSYQIIIQTCPLPSLNQRVFVKMNDINYEYYVSKMNTTNEGEVVNHIDLTYSDQSTESQVFQAVIINGKWKIIHMQNDHELIFQTTLQ